MQHEFDWSHKLDKQFCSVNGLKKLNMNFAFKFTISVHFLAYDYEICVVGLLTLYRSVFCSPLKVLMKSYGC